MKARRKLVGIHWNWQHWLLVCTLGLLPIERIKGQFVESKFDQSHVFDEVTTAVSDEFWDRHFGGVDWKDTAAGFRERAVKASSHDEFAEVINEMLANLKTSHTYFFPTTNPKHFQLLGIFQTLVPDSHSERFTFDGIGIDTKTIDGRVFVSSVFEGLPADQAGLRFGDEIVAIDSMPFHPIGSFYGKSQQEVDVSIRREKNGQPESIQVRVASLDGRTMFEDALENSARIIERGDRKIGYVHVWSYAGAKYHERLVQLVLWGKLSACDALIVDLRDGWGGASLDYVNLFQKPLVEVESHRRDGETSNYSGVWGKPVALLINAGTTSGKELYAFAFRKHQLGPLVGTKSAGAVVAGRCCPLSNGDVLYLAVADLRIDGQRLEGVGVEPDYSVDRPIPFANGADGQLDKAIELLAK